MAQPLYEVTYHPVDLTRHGVNPYGFPVYRVVWADSRVSRVMHKGKIVTLPRYFHGDENAAAGHWILEKWAPGDVILGMSREQYAQFLAQFPDAAAEEYPERGDYEMSLVFPGEVDEALLHKHLQMKEWHFNRMSDEDRRLNLVAQEDAKEKAEADTFEGLYDEARETIIQ